MVKKIFGSDIDKIAASKLNSKVRIKNKDGEIETYQGTTLKKYLRKKVQGGKTVSSLERKLKKEGMVGNQFSKRKKLISSVGGGNKPSLQEQKMMAKREARIKMRNVQLSKMSSEVQGNRDNPMDRVFGGKTGETSEHIGVQRQAGNASALAGSGSAGVQSGAGQQGVSVGSTTGAVAGIGQTAQQASASAATPKTDTGTKPPTSTTDPLAGNDLNTPPTAAGGMPMGNKQL